MSPPVNPNSELVTRVDACLPQTQCTQCGYPRCVDYASAIAQGEANINQCPPGGPVTIAALANLLGKPPMPLDRSHGVHGPRTHARIDEGVCIGCTLCLQACPVDAILGAAKVMHTVIADQCTGCELCVPPCPVDCIDMAPITAAVPSPASPWPGFSKDDIHLARLRTERRAARLARETQSRGAKKIRSLLSRLPDKQTIRAEIVAAVARGRRKRFRIHR